MNNERININYIILIMLLHCTTSCNVWSDLWGNHQLGNHLSLWEGDRNEDRVIVYCTSQSFGACISGIYVVPSANRSMVNGKYSEYVEAAKANENWVIAKTLVISENRENYYIVSKAFNIDGVNCSEVNCDSILQSYVFGPMNLTEFKNTVQEMNVFLNFD